MLYQELPIPFPWYDSKEKQSRFNVNSDEPCGASLITPKDALLPFQFRKSQTSELPESAEIFDSEDDSLVLDVSTGLLPMLLATSFETFDYFTHLGDSIPSGAGFMDLAPGNYYAKLTFPNGEEYFSESFRVPLEVFGLDDITDCKFIRLEWSNPSDIRPIHYNSASANRLVNRLYLDSNIKNSEPEIEQEGNRNGDNELIPSFQKVTVRYRISDLVPDFVKLAISTIPIHENVVLTTEFGKRSGEIFNVSTQSRPEENGYFSEVDILFEQEVAMIRRGCNDVMLPPDCPELPVDIALLITPGTTGFTVVADIPDGTVADIYTSWDTSTPILSVAGVTQAQLAAGYFINYAQTSGDIFTLRLKTFTCTVGDFTPTQSSPALTYHPTVLAFTNAIEADPDASGFPPVNSTMKGWLSDMVSDLANAGILPKLKAIYPFLPFGAPEVSFKYNLKDPRDLNAAFRLDMPNSYNVIGSQGLEFDGINQYANSFYRHSIAYPSQVTPSASLIVRVTDVAFGTTTFAALAGAYGSTTSRFDAIMSGANFAGHSFDTTNAVTKAYGVVPAVPTVHAISRRSATDFEYYKDGVSQNTNSGTQGGTSPAVDMWLGAVNGLPAAGFTAGTFNFFALGEGLTDSEMTTLFTAVDTFNANIGR